jgi:hypothetical protein
MRRPNLIACSRSLFQSVPSTTDQDERSIFLYSASLHNMVTYLKPHIDYKHFSFKNIEIKHFASVIISMQVSTCFKVGSWNVAALALAKLGVIPTFAPHHISILKSFVLLRGITLCEIGLWNRTCKWALKLSLGVQMGVDLMKLFSAKSLTLFVS